MLVWNFFDYNRNFPAPLIEYAYHLALRVGTLRIHDWWPILFLHVSRKHTHVTKNSQHMHTRKRCLWLWTPARDIQTTAKKIFTDNIWRQWVSDYHELATAGFAFGFSIRIAQYATRKKLKRFIQFNHIPKNTSTDSPRLPTYTQRATWITRPLCVQRILYMHNWENGVTVAVSPSQYPIRINTRRLSQFDCKTQS